MMKNQARFNEIKEEFQQFHMKLTANRGFQSRLCYWCDGSSPKCHVCGGTGEIKGEQFFSYRLFGRDASLLASKPVVVKGAIT